MGQAIASPGCTATPAWGRTARSPGSHTAGRCRHRARSRARRRHRTPAAAAGSPRHPHRTGTALSAQLSRIPPRNSSRPHPASHPAATAVPARLPYQFPAHLIPPRWLLPARSRPGVSVAIRPATSGEDQRPQNHCSSYQSPNSCSLPPSPILPSHRPRSSFGYGRARDRLRRMTRLTGRTCSHARVLGPIDCWPLILADPLVPRPTLSMRVEEMAGNATSAIRGKRQEVIRGGAPRRNCT